MPDRITPDTLPAVARAVTDGLPNDLVCHFATSVPNDFSLTDDEKTASGRFAKKRLDDFTGGRYCSSQVLAKLQQPRASIPMGASREPVWPVGIVGSIAHTAGLAGALGTFEHRYAGVGLDLEVLQPMDSLAKQICTAGELQELHEGPDLEHRLSIVFSAKEAVYKCLWPSVRRFVSFHEVELALQPQTGEFRLSWHDGVHRDALRIFGYWKIADGLVATVAVLPRGRQPS